MKITTLCLPGLAWRWEDVAEVAVVPLVTVMKLVLMASCSGRSAEGAAPKVLCAGLIHPSLPATCLEGGPCCESQLMGEHTDLSGGA